MTEFTEPSLSMPLPKKKHHRPRTLSENGRTPLASWAKIDWEMEAHWQAIRRLREEISLSKDDEANARREKIIKAREKRREEIGKEMDMRRLRGMIRRTHTAKRRKGSDKPEKVTPTLGRAFPKLGRNAKCPCNSGAKYKKCCLGKPPQ